VLYTYTGTDHGKPTITQLVDEQSIAQIPCPPQVKAITRLSKSTNYARISQGTTPGQISLGPRLVVWVESDIQKWIAEQFSAARG